MRTFPWPFLLVAGCGGLLDFDVRARVPEQTVAAVAPGALGSLLPPGLFSPVPVDIRGSAEFERQDAGAVRSVTLDSLTLSLTDSSPQRTFDWVDTIQVDARRLGGGGAAIHVAGLQTVPKGLERLSLKPSGNDLTDLAGAEFELVIEMQGRIPPAAANFDGRAVFNVEASPSALF